MHNDIKLIDMLFKKNGKFDSASGLRFCQASRCNHLSECNNNCLSLHRNLLSFALVRCSILSRKLVQYICEHIAFRREWLSWKWRSIAASSKAAVCEEFRYKGL